MGLCARVHLPLTGARLRWTDTCSTIVQPNGPYI